MDLDKNLSNCLAKKFWCDFWKGFDSKVYDVKGHNAFQKDFVKVHLSLSPPPPSSPVFKTLEALFSSYR